MESQERAYGAVGYEIRAHGWPESTLNVDLVELVATNHSFSLLPILIILLKGAVSRDICFVTHQLFVRHDHFVTVDLEIGIRQFA